jgi:hypothetical protein
MLIVEVLDDSTAFTIRNAERFSNYSGYARSWKFAGDCLEKESNQTVIVGIDATVNRFGQADQFGEANHMRDIRKCIAGILPFSGKQFATGGWGTGAFGCDKVAVLCVCVECDLKRLLVSASQVSSAMDCRFRGWK